MPTSPPSHAMPLRRNIKTPKRFEGDVLDTSTPVMSRQRPSLGSMETKSQSSASSQKKSNRSTSTNNSSSTQKKSTLSMHMNATPTPAPTGSTHVETAVALQGQPPRRVTFKDRTPKKAARKSLSNLKPPDFNPPRFSRVPKNTYLGSQSVFNPNLRPAAFPTLDTSERAHEFERQLAAASEKEKRLAIEKQIGVSQRLNSVSARSSVQDPSGSVMLGGTTFQQTLQNPTDAVNSDPGVEIRVHGHAHPARPDFAMTRESHPVSSHEGNLQNESIKAKDPSQEIRGGAPSFRPERSLFSENMRVLLDKSTMHERDEIIEQMETSDEEAKFTRLRATRPVATRIALWDGLPSCLKIHVLDSVYAWIPEGSPEVIFGRLLFTEAQKTEMTRMLLERQERSAQEKVAQAKLQATAQQYLLAHNGRSLSPGRYREMLEETVYQDNDGGDTVEATRRDWRNAQEYVERCGFTGSIFED